MVYSFRSLRLLNRLLRKPLRTAEYRYASTSTAKEELNTELLTIFNQDTQAGGVVPVFRKALLFQNRIALQDDIGTYTYAGLHQAATNLSEEIATMLLGETEHTIAYLCNNNASHVIVQWAIWMTGNIAVPLTSLHPPEMLKYFLTDSNASLVISTQEHEQLLRPISLEVSRPLLITGKDKEVMAQLYQPDNTFMKPQIKESIRDIGKSNMWYGRNDAMLIYTSGTTSQPKGVVWTHNMLSTQIAALHAAWQYTANDVVLHTLPLHHIHGQLNALNASLAAGARIRMLPSFVSHAVWSRLLGMGEREEAHVSVFHGVPAMYTRLAIDYDTMFADAKMSEYVRTTLASRLRLMCAGSAPLPESLFRKWEKISGIRLLERYGMSEVGMALSNPYRPVERREVGCVGRPLPGISARIATIDELTPLVTVETPAPDTQISLDKLGLSDSKDLFWDSEGREWKEPIVTVHKQSKDGEYQGELLLKGPAVFTRYWNRLPQLNSSDFTSDGWFRTGDTASYSRGRFQILGRTSVDIIKTSGYKVSALQVESAILEHPNVFDVAVLGVQHETYGEIVTAVVVLKDKAKLTLRELKDEAGKKLAPYMLPRKLLVVEQMPRNAMGKLDKKEIKKVFGEKLRSRKL